MLDFDGLKYYFSSTMILALVLMITGGLVLYFSIKGTKQTYDIVIGATMLLEGVAIFAQAWIMVVYKISCYGYYTY